MDIQIEKKPVAASRKKPWLIGFGVLLLLLMVFITNSSHMAKVQRSQLMVSKVQKGNLAVEVTGYGTLISDHKQLLTALTAATVTELVLKPGASVNKESVIVRMENTELSQQAENERRELVQLEANLRQLKLTHERELLDEQANIDEVTTRHEAAELKSSIEEKLVKSGIVAGFTYQETRLNAQQLGRKLALMKKRYDKIIKVQKEAVNIQLEQIKQQQGDLAIAEQRIARLVVRAGMDGVLQTLAVSLGQRLSAGEEIAQIGSNSDLIALIKVPQNQAQAVQLGQKAVVDMRTDKVLGEVSRIDPVVADNTVDIEINFHQGLPKSARAQMNVDGTITIDTLTDVLYIERPAQAKANVESSIFRISQDFQSAERQLIRFGQFAGRHIVIRAGAQAGESYILSQLPGLNDVQQLAIE